MCYFQHRFVNGNINGIYKTIPSISQLINRQCIEELSSAYIAVYTILLTAKHIHGNIKPNCPHANVGYFRAANNISISSKSCLHFPIRRVDLRSMSEAIAVGFFSSNEGGTFFSNNSFSVESEYCFTGIRGHRKIPITHVHEYKHFHFDCDKIRPTKYYIIPQIRQEGNVTSTIWIPTDWLKQVKYIWLHLQM